MSAHDVYYVNPIELDVRNYSWPLEEMAPGKHNKKLARRTLPATKRRRVIRQSTPVSDSSSPPHSSRLSGLEINSSLIQNAEERTGVGEIPGRLCHSTKFGEIGNKGREDLRKDILLKYDTKVRRWFLPFELLD